MDINHWNKRGIMNKPRTPTTCCGLRVGSQEPISRPAVFRIVEQAFCTLHHEPAFRVGAAESWVPIMYLLPGVMTMTSPTQLKIYKNDFVNRISEYFC